MDRPLHSNLWVLLALFLVFFGSELYAQPCVPACPDCDLATVNCNAGVPHMTADLSGDPSAVWTSCNIRRGSMIDTCCGYSQVESNERCIEFEITFHPNAVGVILEKTVPNPPGALNYRISCLPGVYQVGDVVCLPAGLMNPVFITFCKPGNDASVYTLRSVDGFAQSAPTYGVFIFI